MNFASNNLGNEGNERVNDRLLFAIKSRGPMGTAALAQVLGITAEAARQQVQRLVQAGLLQGRNDAAGGPGRPRQVWELTEAGYARFPDTHANLTVQLLQSVQQLFGPEGLDKLIGQREVETLAAYEKACAPEKSLERKVIKLAQVRTGEGYMARVEKDSDALLLVEDHCPICAAARTCQGFCRSELDVFQRVLGPEVRVERAEHLLSGGRRCAYRITQA